MHLLFPSLILICILSWIWLESRIVLGIVANITTSEASVAIALAILLLLRRLVGDIPLNWSLRAVGCLLLWWLYHPSSLLLLWSPALDVGQDPETMRLCGGSCHGCFPLLFYSMAHDVVFRTLEYKSPEGCVRFNPHHPTPNFPAATVCESLPRFYPFVVDRMLARTILGKSRSPEFIFITT